MTTEQDYNISQLETISILIDNLTMYILIPISICLILTKSKYFPLFQSLVQKWKIVYFLNFKSVKIIKDSLRYSTLTISSKFSFLLNSIFSDKKNLEGNFFKIEIVPNYVEFLGLCLIAVLVFLVYKKEQKKDKKDTYHANADEFESVGKAKKSPDIGKIMKKLNKEKLDSYPKITGVDEKTKKNKFREREQSIKKKLMECEKNKKIENKKKNYYKAIWRIFKFEVLFLILLTVKNFSQENDNLKIIFLIFFLFMFLVLVATDSMIFWNFKHISKYRDFIQGKRNQAKPTFSFEFQHKIEKKLKNIEKKKALKFNFRGYLEEIKEEVELENKEEKLKIRAFSGRPYTLIDIVSPPEEQKLFKFKDKNKKKSVKEEFKNLDKKIEEKIKFEKKKDNSSVSRKSELNFLELNSSRKQTTRFLSVRIAEEKPKSVRQGLIATSKIPSKRRVSRESHKLHEDFISLQRIPSFDRTGEKSKYKITSEVMKNRMKLKKRLKLLYRIEYSCFGIFFYNGKKVRGRVFSNLQARKFVEKFSTRLIALAIYYKNLIGLAIAFSMKPETFLSLSVIFLTFFVFSILEFMLEKNWMMRIFLIAEVWVIGLTFFLYIEGYRIGNEEEYKKVSKTGFYLQYVLIFGFWIAVCFAYFITGIIESFCAVNNCRKKKKRFKKKKANKNNNNK